MKRAAIVTNIPTPYRLPFFDEVARQLEHEGVELLVVFGSAGYRRRKWDVDLSQVAFSYTVLESGMIELGDIEKPLFSYAGLGKALKQFDPDVIVVGGFSLATIQLWLRSWVDPTPFLIWSGSLKARAPTSWRKAERAVLVRRASAFIAYGHMAKEYLVTLGAPRERVHIAINTVDTTFFSVETDKRRRGRPEGSKRLLSVGYMTRRKRIDWLLEAVRVLARKRSDFALDIVGDGDDRERLEAYVAEHGLGEIVTFHGYKQRSELPGFMAQSCCFVFPSDYDIWGLVLAEAMAAGLPTIASAQAGATPDLVVEGETGFAVDFSDTVAVASAIEWMLDNEDDAQEMGARGRARIQEHASLERSAAGMVAAILSVLDPEAVPTERTSPVG